MPKYQAIRGTHDILPGESALFQRVESIARGVFDRYGYQEIRTPTFESVDLFKRSLGETTDVVEKEMYVFQDRGGRTLALRPEGTAGVVRSFVEHHLDQTYPFCKLFYIGSMFRAERPQAGRYREFWQIGAEFFGSAAPTADAEMLLMIRALFAGFELGDVQLKVNSLGCSQCRQAYREALIKHFTAKKSELCEDCQRRLEKNPLRILDCKVDGPKNMDAPTIDQYWCPECRAHFESVEKYFKAAGGSWTFTPRLVRGLDYYTRTVFEVTTTALGAQDALAAGGRYDNLVKEIDGPDMPALGFAMGLERVSQAIVAARPEQKTLPRKIIFVVTQSDAAAPQAFQLLQQLRQDAGIQQASWVVEGGLFHKKLKAQMTTADRLKAGWVAILGEQELQSKTVTLKNLSTGEQKSIPESELASFLKSLIR